MKKILIYLTLLIFSTPCFAYEDLIINSSEPVFKIENKTPSIISIDTLATIQNERKTIFVNIKQIGKGEFELVLETEKFYSFELNITDTKTEVIRGSEEFDVFVIDDYVKEIEIDLPPGVIWNK